jgi:hypothetical protein
VRRLHERRQAADVRARHGCPCKAERVSESVPSVDCRNFYARELAPKSLRHHGKKGKRYQKQSQQ